MGQGPNDLSYVQLTLRGSRCSGCGCGRGTRAVTKDALGRNISSRPAEGATCKRREGQGRRGSKFALGADACAQNTAPGSAPVFPGFRRLLDHGPGVMGNETSGIPRTDQWGSALGADPLS